MPRFFMVWEAFPFVACAALFLAHAPARAIDYQKVLDQQPWRFNSSAANLLYCVDRDLRDYQLEIRCPKRPHSNSDRYVTVRLQTDGREVFHFRALPETVCARSGDVLYVVEVDPRFNRCAVVATDLNSGTQVWRSHLQGIGLLKFSGYSNRVTVDAEGNVLVIRVHEHSGRYVEYLDRKSGQMVAHRLYLPGAPKFQARLEKFTMLKVLDAQTVFLRSDFFLTHIHLDGGSGPPPSAEGRAGPKTVKLRIGESGLIAGKNQFDEFLLVKIAAGKAVFRHSGVRRNNTHFEEAITVAPYDDTHRKSESRDQKPD